METKRFNTYIIEYKTGIAISKIGDCLTETQADKREMTGLMRCNSEH
jgi:hypothetical protein